MTGVVLQILLSIASKEKKETRQLGDEAQICQELIQVRLASAEVHICTRNFEESHRTSDYMLKVSSHMANYV